MRALGHPSPLTLALTLFAAARVAVAEPNSGALVEVTDASSTLYNFDNRDTRSGEVSSVANDHFGLFYNRLNLHVTSGKLTLSMRADSAWFVTSPTPQSIATELERRESFPNEQARDEFFRSKATQAGIELSNRFINWTYPAKYSLVWGTPDFEIAIGDSYAQLGRGLVLNLRKLDELSSDTTLRGLRVGARLRAGGARVKLSGLAGSLNPLRIDEASGRYLGVDSSGTGGFLRLTEAGMPRAVSTEFVPEAATCQKFGTCSLAPDRLLAGEAELSFGPVALGTRASFLFREPALTPDSVRNAAHVTTGSQSLEFPNLLDHGSAYLEGAFQHLSRASDDAPSVATGYALYASTSWVEKRFSLLAEGKHYRRFFPLSANVSAGRAREFSLLSYSAPPTTEEIWSDTQFGSFNTCATGGRLKGEAHVTASQSVVAWLGRYQSLSESQPNDACDAHTGRENRVWDMAIGFDAHPRGRAARWLVNLGTRLDDASSPVQGPTGPTEVFYRELYLRYSISTPLRGPFTLELQGFHRRRRETVGGPNDRWLEGQHSTAIDYGEHISAAIGLEYDSRPDVPHAYLNAMLSYRPSNALSFGLFAGQRRGMLRCVGGVCRVYPAFEGVRLDATLRY